MVLVKSVYEWYNGISLWTDRKVLSMTPKIQKEMHEKIECLKKEKDVLILAHLYENLDIQSVADYCGDSFELAKKAKASDKQNIVFCGVKFMAESAKILNPEKHIFIPRKDAGCQMADMVTRKDIESLKKAHPDAAVVCYINSSAEIKALCDMCVTSSNAMKIISSMPEKEIIFVPDKNLGSYIAERVKEKTFYIHSGYCPVHKNITVSEVEKAKEKYPEALLLVHPECEKDVVLLSDFAGSTSEIIKYAHESCAKSFIIGTERAVYERLKEECPEKEFFLLSEKLVCEDMKKTTIDDLYNTLSLLTDEVELDEKVLKSAEKCLLNMLEAGK